MKDFILKLLPFVPRIIEAIGRARNDRLKRENEQLKQERDAAQDLADYRDFTRRQNEDRQLRKHN